MSFTRYSDIKRLSVTSQSQLLTCLLVAMTYGPVGEEATIVLSGIGTDLSDGMLMNMYRTYGPIVRVKHNGTNSAQVIFEQKQHAQKAVDATNGAVVYGKTLKVSLQRNFKKTTEPCRGFVAGICRKGDMCKYYHATDDASFASTAPPAVAKAPREPKKKTPKPKPAAPVQSKVAAIPSTRLCRHFTRGYCAQGAECTFAHVLGVAKDAVPAPTGKVAQMCQFYLSGLCARGDACRYIHEPKAGAAPEKTTATKASVQSSSREDESDNGAETKQNEETRTCVECEKPGVAVWKCAKCDNSLYCDDCNSAVHRARVMAKHKRTKLPLMPKLPRCGECESKVASVRCEQCEVPFCASCDSSVHKFKSLRKHTRVNLLGKTEKAKSKTKEDPKPAKKEEKKKTPVVEARPEAMVIEPVSYVESVPQLDFSSESESSESEDEDMAEDTPVQQNTTQIASSSADDDDEPMPTAAGASETESEEDFDDVKPHSSVSVASTPTEQSSESPESESEDDFDDKPGAKLTPPSASMPKMELSSDSDSSNDERPEPATKAVSSESEDESEDEVPSKPAEKFTAAPTHKPTLAELSSESESDLDDKVPSKPAVKKTKTPAAKAVPLPSSAESSSDESEDEAPSKPAPKTKTKASPVSKPATAKTSSSSSESSESSSSESSDSSEDEAPAKPAAKPTPAPRRAPVSARNNKAGGISEGSSHTLVKKIEAFNESGEGDELHLDANLNGFERLLAHDCAERLGLAHESIGSGLERHIIISRHSAKRAAADSGHGHKSKKSKHRH